MDKLFRIDPECSADFGDNGSWGVHSIVLHLHLEFEGWLGDDLGSIMSEYYVSDRLKNVIEDANLSGCFFDKVEVTKSLYFEDMEPDVRLPEFHWLRVFGEIGKDDIALFKNVDLIVNERALACFKTCNLKVANIYPWSLPRGFF